MADKVVEIPGIGNVEFPDSMSNEDISAAIRRTLQNPVGVSAEGLPVYSTTVTAAPRVPGMEKLGGYAPPPARPPTLPGTPEGALEYEIAREKEKSGIPTDRWTLEGIPVETGLRVYQGLGRLYGGAEQAFKGRGELTAPFDIGNVLQGFSDIAHGGATMATPFVAPEIAASPVSVGVPLAAGGAALSATVNGLKALGLPPEYANYLGDLAGIVAGVGSGRTIGAVESGALKSEIMRRVETARNVRDAVTGQASKILKSETAQDLAGIASPRLAHAMRMGNRIVDVAGRIRDRAAARQPAADQGSAPVEMAPGTWTGAPPPNPPFEAPTGPAPAGTADYGWTPLGAAPAPPRPSPAMGGYAERGWTGTAPPAAPVEVPAGPARGGTTGYAWPSTPITLSDIANPPRAAATSAAPAAGSSLSDLVDAARGIVQRQKAPEGAPLSEVGRTPPEPEPMPASTAAEPRVPGPQTTEGLSAKEAEALRVIQGNRVRYAMRTLDALKKEGKPFSETSNWSLDKEWKDFAEKRGEKPPSQETVDQILAEQRNSEIQEGYQQARVESTTRVGKFADALRERQVDSAGSLKYNQGNWNDLAKELGLEPPKLKEIQQIRKNLEYGESLPQSAPPPEPVALVAEPTPVATEQAAPAAEAVTPEPLAAEPQAPPAGPVEVQYGKDVTDRGRKEFRAQGGDKYVKVREIPGRSGLWEVIDDSQWDQSTKYAKQIEKRIGGPSYSRRDAKAVAEAYLSGQPNPFAAVEQGVPITEYQPGPGTIKFEPSRFTGEKGFMHNDVNGRDMWTNGHVMFDVASGKAKVPLGDASPNLKMEPTWNQYVTEATGDIKPVGYSKSQNVGQVHFDNGTAVNSNYFDFARKNFKNVSFKGKDAKSPVVVYSGDNPVGLIMPMRVDKLPPGIAALTKR